MDEIRNDQKRSVRDNSDKTIPDACVVPQTTGDYARSSPKFHMAVGIYASFPLSPQEKFFRLLQVQRGYESSIPTCDIRVVRAEDQPKYWALSYTWGAPSFEAATCQGMNVERRLPIALGSDEILVTENLYQFLTHLIADSTFNHELWIDAICIDQNNEEERGHQVDMMSSIYESAERVLIWLGEQDEYTIPAFELLAVLSTLDMETLLTMNPNTAQYYDESKRPGACGNPQNWFCLGQLFRRTWFTRAWIFQEVILAKEAIVLCGDQTIPWASLVHVSRYLSQCGLRGDFNNPAIFGERGSYPPSRPSIPATLNRAKSILKSDGDRVFLNSLLRSRRLDATDLRDKIYSTLGISKLMSTKLSDKTAIYPDYTRNLADVYISATRHVLTTVDDLLVLSAVERELQTIDGLPSWVPDWSIRDLIGLGIIGNERFSAASSLPRDISLPGPDMVLGVKALKLDTIVQSGETKEEVKGGKLATGWLEILAKLDPCYSPTKERRQDAFWRTLLTDTAGSSPPDHPAPCSLQQVFKVWLLQNIAASLSNENRGSQAARSMYLALKSLEDDSNLDSVIPTSNQIMAAESSFRENGSDLDLVRKALPFDTAFSHALLLRIFLTCQGYLGLGAQSLRNGDTIWIVPGSRVPLIGRLQASGRYVLVGAAYVHGFMHGEAIAKKSNVKFEFVELE
jgi:hypothetical protein